MLREYLEAIWVRLECAQAAANDREDFIPGLMLDFVDADLNRYKAEKGANIKALTKKIKHGRKLID